MVFENAFVAKNSLRKLIERMRADEREHPLPPAEPRDDIHLPVPLEPLPGIKLSDNIAEAIVKMERIEELTKTFKGWIAAPVEAPPAGPWRRISYRAGPASWTAYSSLRKRWSSWPGRWWI